MTCRCWGPGMRPGCGVRSAASHKSDVIDADVLARAGEVFDLHPLRPVDPAQLALRRACVRRGAAVIDGNRYLRRLISLARWAFPDVWNGFRGSLPTAVAVLERWPHLAQLAAARRSTLTGVVALHTRGVADVPARVEAIRSAAAAWAAFWDGHLDLDALAFDVTEHLHRHGRREGPDRAGHRRRRSGTGGSSTATTSCCCRCPGWGRSPAAWSAASSPTAPRSRRRRRRPAMPG